MHPVNLIARALSPDDPDRPASPDGIALGTCCVTGEECNTVPRRAVLGRSFTDGATLAAPASPRIGLDAYTALRYKWERMSSWRCDGETFLRLDRLGVRNAVLNPVPVPRRPWAGYATTSYKKHGALRAPVNDATSAVWLFESRLVDCSDPRRVQAWWQCLIGAQRRGFSRPVLETLDCPPVLLRQGGLREWLAFERWARPRYRSALYAFLCYLLPSKKELADA